MTDWRMDDAEPHDEVHVRDHDKEQSAELFTVCSFFCGTATSLSQLVVFRLLQGFFGGGLQPTQQAIILDTFPPEQRAAAFGATAIATIVAPVLGPTLGGVLTDTFN